MAKPTAIQVKQLENNHKIQYLDLVTANRLWIKLLGKLPRKNGVVDKTTNQYKSLIAFGNTIAKLAGKWYVRQKKFETKAKIPSVNKNIVAYFLNPKEEKNLYETAKTYLAPNSEPLKGTGLLGIGIIPLIIWGVIAIVAAFTAYEITDELNTTAEEKQELLKQTEKTLKDLNVTGPEAAAIISQTQKEASSSEGGFFSGLLPKIGIGLLLFYLFTNSQKQKSNG